MKKLFFSLLLLGCLQGSSVNAAQAVAPFQPTVTPDGGDTLLAWEYRHPGDYNQDGLVGVSDITPLGVYYLAREADAQWAIARGADGNGDGMITVSDYTTIGQNYGKFLREYVVEGAPAPAGPWTELKRVQRIANPSGTTEPMAYSCSVANIPAYAEFRIWGEGDTPSPIPQTRLERFNTINHFMYQIQGLEEPGAIAALSATHYDLLVIEPTNTVTGSEGFDTAGMVSQLHASSDSRGGGKLVLAYVDIGEAEDPDGWSGNYPVAYWDQRWIDIMVDAPDSVLNQAIDAGFDGIYMDWVEAYDDERVLAAALEDGIDAPQAMVTFIARLRDAARLRDPEFLVVQQNAPYLIEEATGLIEVIDGLAMEDIWFLGDADVDWGDPRGGDIPQDPTGDYSTAALLQITSDYQHAGLLVISVDYCLDQSNATEVYAAATGQGLVPLVTQTSLMRITGTPPPWYQ